jgi:phosphohistidine phosphatase
MELYILRHGDAGPARATAEGDNARVLTPHGEQEIRRLGDFLQPRDDVPSAFLVSPLPRAQRTAEIIHEIFAPEATLATHESLVRQDLHGILNELVEYHPRHRCVMIVGHEPLLSMLGSVILSGIERPLLELTKGGLLHVSMFHVNGLRPRGFLKLMVAPRDLP